MVLTALAVPDEEIRNYAGWKTKEMLENYRHGIEEAYLRKKMSQIVDVNVTDTIGERLGKLFEKFDAGETIAMFTNLRMILGIQTHVQIKIEDHRTPRGNRGNDKGRAAPQTRVETGFARNLESKKIRRYRKSRKENKRININSRDGLRKLENLCKRWKRDVVRKQ